MFVRRPLSPGPLPRSASLHGGEGESSDALDLDPDLDPDLDLDPDPDRDPDLDRTREALAFPHVEIAARNATSALESRFPTHSSLPASAGGEVGRGGEKLHPSQARSGPGRSERPGPDLVTRAKRARR